MRLIASIAIVIFAFASCKQTSKTVSNDPNTFGEDFKVKEITDFDALVSALETQDTVFTVVQAKVESVCQVKGCWMNLVSPSASSEDEIFVKFKDYAFFMPLDLAGNEVIVNGKAYKEITSVDELRHYAEDEGQSPEEIAKITEPAEELKIMADGVKLVLP